MIKLTQPRHQLDPVTRQVIQHYGEGSVFTVYLKRFNGRKVTVYMGTGNELLRVLEYYHNLKVYLHDRKYLFHRVADAPKETEEKIMLETGTAKRTTPSMMGKKINYMTKDMPPLKNIPQSLMEGIQTYLEKGLNINATALTKVRLISILMAQFLDMPEKDQVNFLSRGDLELEKHKIMSGAKSKDMLGLISQLDELKDEPHEEDLL